MNVDAREVQGQQSSSMDADELRVKVGQKPSYWKTVATINPVHREYGVMIVELETL